MRKLGDRQSYMLSALKQRKYWHANCGWLWSSVRETTRIMDSLVQRGLATTVLIGEVTRYIPVSEEQDHG